MLRSLDLAVLRPENQNPTHVTPLIDNLARGLFHERLYVVGPRASRPSKYEIRRQQEDVRSCVCELLYRNLEELHNVSFPAHARMRDEYWNAVSIRGVLYEVRMYVHLASGRY